MERIATDVIATLNRRASCRRFTDDDVPTELIDEIIYAALRAPTSFNLQPYALIVIRDPERRSALAQVTHGQPHVADAPVFVAVCSDLRRVEGITGLSGELDRGQHEDALLNSIIDASLVGMCLSVAADSVSLGNTMVGGIRDDHRKVSQLLRLPVGVYPLFGICLGWPAPPAPAQPRQVDPTVVHHERYQQQDARTAVGLNHGRICGNHGRHETLGAADP